MRASMLLSVFVLVAGCLGDLVPPNSAGPKMSPHDGGTVTPAPGADAGGIDPQCGQQTFPISVTKTEPNVMLVVDESGSMSDTVTGSTLTKWDALKQAVKGLLSKYDGQVDWGLSIFPAVGAADSCAPGIIDVPIAPGSGPLITAKLDGIAASTLTGATPTPESLKSVQLNGKLNDPKKANYILLITDGDPTCAPATDVTPVIQALYAQSPSVKTFVVGVGDVNQSNPALLNEWADAGHTARTGATRYYDANDLSGLQGAFATIVGNIASCNYALGKLPDDPSLVTAYLDGKVVPIDPVNGATYDAMSNSITFHGTTCDAIKSGASSKVDIVYGCKSPTIS